MTLAIGTGRTFAFGPPRYLNSGMPIASAAAFAFASDTARIAFAPSLDLVSVPLMTLAIGAGNTFAFGPPRYWRTGMPIASAAAFAFASDTARIAKAAAEANGI